MEKIIEKNLEKYMKKKLLNRDQNSGKTKLNLECQWQIIWKHKKNPRKKRQKIDRETKI